MSLRVALVGCGKIAEGHIEEINKMPAKAKVIAVCDIELLMAEQLAARFNIPSHYGDFEQMLSQERPDVVHITTPPQSHLALATRALEAGCHVYVEKPLTLTHPEAESLLAQAKLADKKLTIGYSYYFDPPAIALRDLLESGAIGEPVHVESFYGYNLASPFGAALLADGGHWVNRLPGKLAQNNLDHILYKIIDFIPDDTPCISAFGSVRREMRFDDARDDMIDELRIMIQGKKTSAYGTFSSHVRPVGNFTRVYGTKNTVHVDYNMRTVTLDASPVLPSAIGRLIPAFQQGWRFLREGARNIRQFAKSEFHYFAGLNRLISLFYDCILENTVEPIKYRDILRISAMMDEVFRQVDQGGKI